MLRKMILIVSAGALILGTGKLVFATSCGDHSGSQQLAQVHSEHEHGTAEATKDIATKESVNVGNKICPVSGERIEEGMKATYEYNGKVYSFCCASCIEEFKKYPDKYIEKVNAEFQAQGKKEAKQN